MGGLHKRNSAVGKGDIEKICHVATVDSSVRFLLLNQLRFLRSSGLEVHVACSDGKWLPEIEAEGFPAHRVEMKRFIAPVSDLAALYSLYCFFLRERFDLVHLHTPKASLLGALAARIARVPRVVYTIHGFYFHEDMPWFRRRFYLFWERVIASCVDISLSQNRSDLGTALHEGLYKEGQISFLGNGIDLYRFNPSLITDVERKEIRHTLGLPEGSRVVGIVARMVREKGFRELFDAMEFLSEKYPDLYLLVVGPSDEAKKDALLADTLKKTRAGNRIVFTGMRLDVQAMYSVMDIFVLPSYREGFPRVVMEASAMALPVVATDIRGSREAVVDGVTGFLVPPKDSGSLAEAIAKMLDNPGLAHKMGEEGRNKALREFDEREIFQRVSGAYDGLAKSTN